MAFVDYEDGSGEFKEIDLPDTPYENDEFAKALHEKRMKGEVTLGRLAAETGHRPAFISGVERGEYTIPDDVKREWLAALDAIAQAET